MRSTLLLPALAGIFLLTGSAFGDSYTLSIDHCTGGCGTAPFGTVTVTQDGTNTVKVITSLTSGDSFVSTGFPGSFGFDIVGDPHITVSNLTSGWSLLSRNAGSLHFDGFGEFDYALVCTACGNGGSHPFSQPISFDVTAAGLTPTSFALLSTIPPGTESAYFVADILGSTGKTGPVGATTPGTVTPEPSAFLLFGAGALLLGLSSLRRRAKA
jgi:hypothetical protein